MTLVNEILEEVIANYLETRNLMKSTLIAEPRLFGIALFRSITNPWSSIALQFIIGLPLPFMLEVLLSIVENITSNTSQIFENIISLARKYLEFLFSTIKNLIDKIEADDLKRVVAFYLYREIFFASNLLSQKLRENLLKSSIGRSFLKLFKDASLFLERIYGQKIEKKEDISDLFA